MKKVSLKRMLALTLASAMVLTACGQEPANTDGSKDSGSNGTEADSVISIPEVPEKISIFPANAKVFSGPVGGYRGEVLAEHGIELEIWAYSADKVSVMLATGDFPDMMYVGGNGETLKTLIETDKIINYDDYAEYLPHVLGDKVQNPYITENLDVCREQFSAGTGGLYVLPFNTGRLSSYYQELQAFDRYTPKLKWDVYEAIGAPEITDMWSLIDIVEDMLKKQPYAPDGTKMQGTFLDNSDASAFNSLTLWMLWHGSNIEDTPYMAERDITTGEVNYILDKDSIFKEGLQWYNEMYLRGLIDPDSISTSRTDQAPKLDNGYAMLPAGSLPGYAPTYFEVFPEDCTLYSSYESKNYTGSSSIVIFKDSENIEACLRYVDLLANQNEYMKLVYGPEGCMWQEENGVVSITPELAAWLEERGTLNFFPMPDGTEWSIYNVTPLVGNGTPLAGLVGTDGKEVGRDPATWPDAQAIRNKSANYDAWKKTMDADNLRDYIAKNEITLYQESPFDGVTKPTPSDSQRLTISSLKDTIVNACWKMVYAQSESEFEQIWARMVEDAEILGAKEIYNWYKEGFRPRAIKK